jgi:uncharacterized protein YukE
MNDQLQPFTPTNSTTGAGVFDSWHNVELAVQSIKTAHGGDQAAVAVELGIVTVSAVLDTVAFALDPFAKLIAAGLGWLIEHVKFLRWPLDQLAGNPDQIKLLAQSLHRTGEDLRNTADDMDRALHRVVADWQGAGHDSFEAEATARREHITGSAEAVDTAGYVVETTMALIVTVRSLIRDIITTLIADIIVTMLIALGLALITFGASIAIAVSKCVVTAAVQCSAMAAKLAKIAAFARRVAFRLRQLATLTRNQPAPPSPPPAASGATTGAGSAAREAPAPPKVSPAVAEAESLGIRATDEPFSIWLAADRYFNSPPPAPARTATHEAPAPHPAVAKPAERAPVPVAAEPRPTAPRTSSSGSPQSLLRPWDIPVMKKHEEYFKQNYAQYWDKNKYFENLVRTRLPEQFPLIKALSDTKTSKNWAGWIGKSVVNMDRSLTDIHQQAVVGWQESDEKWRSEHPDPAAGEVATQA